VPNGAESSLKREMPDHAPSVSVIMPVRQEASSISRSLEAVLAQDYPKDQLEIVVADGRSTDGTREIVRALQQRHANFVLVDNPGLIVSTGLNAALCRARGEIIVRVDGHTEIAPDYVRQCVAALGRSGADNVGGRMRATGIGAFGEAVAVGTSSLFGVGNARFHYSENEEWVDTVYMGAWRREVFTRLGLFDEELVRDQDDEFNYRLSERGGRILLSPAIRSRYTARSTPPSLWRQYFQYGYWKVRVMQKHPRQMRIRQFIPAAFVISCVLAVVASLVSRAGIALLALVLVPYIIANVVASIVVARRRGWQCLSRLPMVFAILHSAYGAGFVTGFIRFSTRWRDRRGLAPYSSDGAA